MSTTGHDFVAPPSKERAAGREGPLALSVSPKESRCGPGARPAVLGRRLQGDGHLAEPVLAVKQKLHRITRGVLGDGGRELVRRVDRMPIDGDDDVCPGLELRLLRGARRSDSHHTNAMSHSRCLGLSADPEPRRGYGGLGRDVREERPDGRDGSAQNDGRAGRGLRLRRPRLGRPRGPRRRVGSGHPLACPHEHGHHAPGRVDQRGPGDERAFDVDLEHLTERLAVTGPRVHALFHAGLGGSEMGAPRRKDRTKRRPDGLCFAGRQPFEPLDLVSALVSAFWHEKRQISDLVTVTDLGVNGRSVGIANVWGVRPAQAG